MQLHRILSFNVGNGSLRQLLFQLSSIWRQMKCTMDSESSICYMKSIHHSEIASLSKRSRISFESNEWKKIILKSLEYEKIYIPVDTTSYSSDILFKLHSVDLASSLPEGLSCSDIISEAEKFRVPIHDQVLSESLKTCHCMLIVVDTKLSSSVARELKYEGCCHSSGSLIDSTFEILINCEIIILSEKDVEMFIGHGLLNGLGIVFARTDKPNWHRLGIDLCSKFVVG
eukprot:jgi/Galph1/1716/GphlegSOOS_G431.1